ncbi:pyridoxamine 5'-phosphate oxidase family protein [Glycomyces artemisiae]|uniref:Pyridoxamine 5'-phosphate oxidase-like protein n=1 Tax=Glycomyces artemisiae TaxID=1076443 RepID=A0A2T0UGA2_9ACTN|nr:pyridoxamine 5'-phosphate oxidase family protein [Glycomyces artemisiae]PRY56975.1 pyridoxamine 5'-phosphate oxidase-like protein [Glycomyces artemisiae]
MAEVTAAEAMALLAGVPVGRLGFHHRGLPAIRPVNHLVEDGQILIRTHFDSRLSAAVAELLPQGVVVAYEADDLDFEARAGWSVVAVGTAQPVTAPDRLAHFEGRPDTWVDQPMNKLIAIQPEIVTGFRIEPAR